MNREENSRTLNQMIDEINYYEIKEKLKVQQLHHGGLMGKLTIMKEDDDILSPEDAIRFLDGEEIEGRIIGALLVFENNERNKNILDKLINAHNQKIENATANQASNAEELSSMPKADVENLNKWIQGREYGRLTHNVNPLEIYRQEINREVMNGERTLSLWEKIKLACCGYLDQ